MLAKIDHILIRYGELSTKKKNRRFFVKQLILNIKNQLKATPLIRVIDKYDRILVELNGEDIDVVIEKLKHIFGIANFTPIVRCESNVELIAQIAAEQMSKIDSTTFKVITSRKIKTLAFISDDVNRAVAGAILDSSHHKVDVHHPEIKIRIEVSAKETLMGFKTYPGLQGLPVGVSGKTLLLMSGGIDSPVAAYLMMKRGVSVECVHFETPPYTSAQALEKVKNLVKILTLYQAEIPLHIVDFTALQQEIYRPIEKRYGITIMRRFFVRIANLIAQERKCSAIVTGDSIGQVASQTVESMETIQDASIKPIFRPLLTYDKLEIINLAQTIGTYETSILPFEDCCTLYAVNSPKTKPRIYFTQEQEEKCEGLDDLMKIAYESKVSQIIDSSMADYL